MIEKHCFGENKNIEFKDFLNTKAKHGFDAYEELKNSMLIKL